MTRAGRLVFVIHAYHPETVNVVFLVNEDLNGDLSTGTVKVQSALTGRNTSYGFPVGVCSTEPTD